MPGKLTSLSSKSYTELLTQISSRFIEVKAATVGLTTKPWSFQPAIFDAGNFLYEHSRVVSAENRHD